MKFLAILFFSLVFCQPSIAASGKPLDDQSVVVTIKPLHSLVQAVLGDSARADLLLEGAATPHGYQMKPSEQRAVLHADVVFFIDANMESFLAKSLNVLDPQTLQVPLADVAGIDLLKKRSGEEWEKHDHAHHEEPDEHDHDDHEHGHDDEESAADKHAEHGFDSDLHIWLDPQNAIKMVEAIRASLSGRFPEQAGVFADNASALVEQLRLLDAALGQQLSGLEQRPFVVFHDAYGYFEKRYGLQGVGSILLDPQISPSISQIRKIRERISESGAVCIFSEPQFSASLLDTVMEGLSVRRGVLDPLGSDIEPGAAHYFSTLRALAQGFADCLSGA
ncbi:MAG: zinc ABC transporter substrate-binding protein [Gammaproteobacteria bacterium]|nr:zinc ABC transporter substrate-binding protein [Gammaproteobacteria bacterium]